MSLHLDLEEQEQVDQLKHFWKQYGNLISWVMILVFGSLAAVNGWNYWQRNQSEKASVMFDEVEKAINSRDVSKIERALADMRDSYGRTTLAHQAALYSAKTLYELGKTDSAQSALAWVADRASDEGLQAIAHLRLAALLIDKKAYADASKQLDAIVPNQFGGLVADRRGDLFMAQGQIENAKTQYQKAWGLIDEDSEYKKLIEAKLNALGIDIAASKGRSSQAPASEGQK